MKFNPKKKRGIHGISEYTEEKNNRIYGNNRKILIFKNFRVFRNSVFSAFLSG